MCLVTTTMWLLPKTFWRLTNIDIYIYKISRWSYSILSKVFIWIQSSKKKWFENATFRHVWKLFSANRLLSEFWSHIPVNKHFSYDLQKISTPSPSQEKASVPISWIFYYSTEYECLFHKNGQTASHISGLNYHIEIQ